MVLARQLYDVNNDDLSHFIFDKRRKYYLVEGDAAEVLQEMPSHFVDSCLTSPPYWAKRDYGNHGGLGAEKSWQEYVDHLVDIFKEVRRVLKPEGSLWLNLGDTYQNKNPGTRCATTYQCENAFIT